MKQFLFKETILTVILCISFTLFVKSQIFERQLYRVLKMWKSVLEISQT